MKYAAIHIVTRSNEHHTFLVSGKTELEMIDQVVKKAPVLSGWWSNIYSDDSQTGRDVARGLWIHKNEEENY